MIGAQICGKRNLQSCPSPRVADRHDLCPGPGLLFAHHDRIVPPSRQASRPERAADRWAGWRVVHRPVLIGLLVAMAILGVGFPARGQAPAAGLDLILVLDQSGSMKQSDPQRLLIQAVAGLVKRLTPQDAAGLVAFGGQARAVSPLTPLGTEDKRQALLQEIAQIRYGEARTNMAAGIERGLYELRHHGRKEATPILVFLTDGIMDTGSEARNAEMRDWLRTRLLPEARDAGIRIFSIALTEQADYAMIQELASATKGDYFRALNVGEIAPIFEKIHARAVAPPPPPPPQPAPAVAPPPPARAERLAEWSAIWMGATVCLLVVMTALLLRRRSARVMATQRVREDAAAPPRPSTAQISPAARGPLAYLREKRTGKPVPLTLPVMRIGRASDNDHVLAESQVSSHHAEIELRQGHYYLRDLRSTNGTWVNQQRVETETILKSGDVIRFDEFAYTFFSPETRMEGTMIREVGAGTMIREAPKEVPKEAPKEAPKEVPREPVRSRPSAATLGETAVLDTVDDRVGPSRCPAHPSFEATEQCERCGKLWCALCNPPVTGRRICRQCKEAAKTQKHAPNPAVGGSAAQG